MEFNIAIIDDDHLFFNQLEAIISQVADSNKVSCNISCFDNYDDLLNNIDIYHSVFLDIEMPQINGLDLAKIIREHNNDIPIVFVSSYTDYVFSSFSLKPFAYIVKNNLEDFGCKEIKRLLTHLCDNNKIINVGYQLKIRDIMVVSKSLNYCYFVVKKQKYKSRVSLKQVLKELPNYFVLINRGDVINLNYVNWIKDDEIELEDGTIYYISRRRLDAVSQSYFDFIADK